jgi:hypothetical protein
MDLFEIVVYLVCFGVPFLVLTPFAFWRGKLSVDDWAECLALGLYPLIFELVLWRVFPPGIRKTSGNLWEIVVTGWVAALVLLPAVVARGRTNWRRPASFCVAIATTLIVLVLFAYADPAPELIS